MAVTCSGDDTVLTLEISGEVDHHHAKDIMKEVACCLERQPPRQLILDLKGVTFMDSSGIAVLLRTHRQATQLGGSFAVRNTPPQAEKVLKAAGIDKLVCFV